MNKQERKVEKTNRNWIEKRIKKKGNGKNGKRGKRKKIEAI